MKKASRQRPCADPVDTNWSAYLSIAFCGCMGSMPGWELVRSFPFVTRTVVQKTPIRHFSGSMSVFFPPLVHCCSCVARAPFRGNERADGMLRLPIVGETTLQVTGAIRTSWGRPNWNGPRRQTMERSHVHHEQRWWWWNDLSRGMEWRDTGEGTDDGTRRVHVHLLKKRPRK